MRFFEFLIRNWRVVFLLLVLLPTLSGFLAFSVMPKELNPDIALPLALVIVPYPGAAPEEVESLIIDPLEAELQGLKNVDNITSTSSEGVGSVVVTFLTGTDIDEAIRETKEAVSDAISELPSDALDPEVLELNFNDFPIVVVSLTGSDDYVALTSAADDLREEIESLPDVLEARIIGGVEREFRVEVDPDRLAAAGVTLDGLMGSIAMSNVEVPGGALGINNTNFLVRVEGKIETAEDLGKVVAGSGPDGLLYVRDVATVVDGYEEIDSYSRVNGRPAVSLAIKKRQGSNTIGVTKNIKATLEEAKAWLPPGFELIITGEQVVYINDTLDQMKGSALNGFFVVMVTLVLFLGLRNATITALVIPLSIFIAFSFLWAFGVSLNTITLFSIVLVIGMIVDNAIVVVENIFRHLQLEKRRYLAALKLDLPLNPEVISREKARLDAVPREELPFEHADRLPLKSIRMHAAAVGAREVTFPILTATMTTVCAFMPMLIMGGVMGDFLGYIPKTVSLTLAASFLVAMLVNPVVSSKILRCRAGNEGRTLGRGERIMESLKHVYVPTLTWALEHRKLVLLLIIPYAAIAILLFASGIVPIELFPADDIGQLYINVEAPIGTRVEHTDRFVRTVEELVSRPEWARYSENVVANVGYSGASTVDFASGSAEHFAQIMLDLKDKEDRDLKAYEIEGAMRPLLATIPGAEVEFQPIESGPPTGAPVELKIVGKEMDQLLEISAQVKAILSSIPGTVDVRDDYVSGSPRITIHVDRDRAALYGVAPAMVAGTVRTALYGATATVVRTVDDDIDVTVEMAEKFRTTRGAIAALKIPTMTGGAMPLQRVADLTVSEGGSEINHINKDRVIRVKANNQPGVSAVTITQKLRSKLSRMPLPSGYRFDYSGDWEQTEESFQAMGQAFIIAIILIYILMVAQFGSFKQPFVILATIPLAIVGSIIGLAFGGQTFALVALIAIVGLSGVVVNAAILLVDNVNARIRSGTDTKTALIEAAQTRLRPIILTAVTTMGGLLPLTMAQEGWRPLGYAFIFGLGFATLLTLIVIPVVYFTLERRKGNE